MFLLRSHGEKKSNKGAGAHHGPQSHDSVHKDVEHAAVDTGEVVLSEVHPARVIVKHFRTFSA